MSSFNHTLSHPFVFSTLQFIFIQLLFSSSVKERNNEDNGTDLHENDEPVDEQDDDPQLPQDQGLHDTTAGNRYLLSLCDLSFFRKARFYLIQEIQTICSI